MKIVTLQSVSGARLKIAAFGKMTHSVTCIVALLKRGGFLSMGYRRKFRLCRSNKYVREAMRAKPTPL